jgi:4-hydroxybenzoate polyprenyltransferase
MIPPVTIRGRHTVLDYVFFTRPVLLPPVWTIALLGVVSAGDAEITVWRWVALFAQLAFLFGAVYTLNQIFDVESDRANRKLFFLPERIITVPTAWGFTIALDISALALSLIVSWTYLALSGAIVILGILYSAGTHPWKDHPFAGFLANAIAHGLIVYSMGVQFAGGSLTTTSLIRGAAYALAVGGVYLATTVADADGDRASNKRTFAVIAGPKATMLWAFLLVLLATAVSLWQRDFYLTIAALCALPFFGRALIGDTEIWAPRAAKAGVGALTIAAAVAYPAYLIILVAGFFFTRLFFLWRFGLAYPTFD